ncbi:MAG: hypothetical protein D6707_09705 [Bacteroidetes bacterium]|nr:MAG: hypothetical protein D6707_09705 [Bacteroidota bacterium]
MMIINYENKMRALFMLQTQDGICQCGLSGERIIPHYHLYDHAFFDVKNGKRRKIDFAHIIPRTKNNIKLYPTFIDSIFNGVAALHEAHLASNRPNAPEKKYAGLERYFETLLTDPWQYDLPESAIEMILKASDVVSMRQMSPRVEIIRAMNIIIRSVEVIFAQYNEYCINLEVVK